MKAIPKEDLLVLIDKKSNRLVWEDALDGLFEQYGDDYYYEGNNCELTALNEVRIAELDRLKNESKNIYTKEDVINVLTMLLSIIDNMDDPLYLAETHELPLDIMGKTVPLETYASQCYTRGWEDTRDVIEKYLNVLKE